ncbi:hypothetical protein [Streptomyces sp. NPDC054834]
MPSSPLRIKRAYYANQLPDVLIESDWVQRKAVLANCSGLDALAKHVRTFAHMVTDLHSDRLSEWIEAARTATDLPSLSRFAQRLERDLDAAGLTLTWNSGVAEGHVNHIKTFRRQMFCRVSFV